MGSAYTPGLTVSSNKLVQRMRRLPIKGEVLVKIGDVVSPDTPVARAMLPGLLQTIRLGEKLGVEAKEAPGMLRLSIGDTVHKGQVIAETRGFLGRFKRPVTSEFDGTIESSSEITGNVLVREASIPIEIKAYIRGTVVDVLPEEGAVIEARAALVQGIFGVGGERFGPIRVVVSSPEELLDATHIRDDHAGAILVGGSGVTAAALKRATEVGVFGLIVGAVRDMDLTEFLGYDIGVAITGQEPIELTLVCTEGFGQLTMAQRTFKLLQSLEGQEASINGATQIRAGVIRPEVIVPQTVGVEAEVQDEESTLEIGTPIRVIREPYFGCLGKVTGLPAQLKVVDSGAEVRVLTAKLDDGREVLAPRANVEIIAGG